jgi:signal transduction histidine kinase
MSPTVEQVLAVLAHELRTPIGVAQSYLRLMREGSTTDPARVPLVERTRDALTRVSEVTRQSDELARQLSAVATATVQPVPVELVVNAIADICSAVSIPYTKPNLEGESLQGHVRAARPDVVAAAFSALLEGLRRERAELEVHSCIKHRLAAPNGSALRFVVAPKADLAAVESAATWSPVPVDRGGLGLSFVGSVLLLCACGARPWTLEGVRTAAVVDFSLEE